MKKRILLIVFIISQSTHTALQSALQALTPYKHEIAYGISFCASELACSKKLSIPFMNIASLCLSHAMILNKHKNYSPLINSLAIVTMQIFQKKMDPDYQRLNEYQTIQDRLIYLLVAISGSYCELEHSPLFFRDPNVNWLYQSLSSFGCNHLLTNNPLELQSMHISYAFSKAIGILKTPFPNAYNILPSKITHYANQPTIKAKAAVLLINILQNIAYICFTRFGFLNMMKVIDNRVITPLLNKFTAGKKKAASKHKINLVPYISCIASGIILFACCDKMLELFYQKGFICVQDAVQL